VGWVGRVRLTEAIVAGVAKVLRVRVDLGGGDNRTPDQYAPAGDDYRPLPTDWATGYAQQGTGRHVVVGYVDPSNAQTAQPGERRLYARDGSGAQVAEFHLKGDGTARASNAGGYFELKPDGSVEANGAQITPDGDFITSDGISLRGHKHVGNLGSLTSPPQPEE